MMLKIVVKKMISLRHSSKDIFYELENLSEIKARTILKLFETDGSGRGLILLHNHECHIIVVMLVVLIVIIAIVAIINISITIVMITATMLTLKARLAWDPLDCLPSHRHHLSPELNLFPGGFFFFQNCYCFKN